MNTDLNGYKFTTVNTSIGHTCGNITSIMLEHVKNMFPPKYFKNQYIGTRIALKEFKRILGFNGLDLKKDKPIIAIQPKLSIDQTEFGLDNVKRLYGNTNYNDSRYNSIHDNILLNIPDKEVFLVYNAERMRMEFSMAYIVSTELQQYNLYGYMNNKFRIDHPYTIDKLIELEIPIFLMEEISTKMGYNIKDPKEVADFVRELNANSTSPITYKLQTSTGKFNFFIYVTVQIMITMDGRLSVNDGEKEGQVEDDFTITQDIKVEFNYINIIHYYAKDYTDGFLDSVDEGTLEIMNQSEITPVYTIQQANLVKFNEAGYKLNISVIYDIEDFEKDVTDISSLFSDNLISVINYFKKNGISLDELFSFKVFKDENELEYGIDFEFDYDTYELITHNAQEHFTYRVALYVNQVTYNKFLANQNNY